MNLEKIGNENGYELLKKILDSIPRAVMLVDNDGKLLYINQLFCDLFDVEMGKFETTNPDLYHAYFATKILNYDYELETFQQLIKEKKSVFDDTIKTIKGRILRREFLPQKLNDGTYIFVTTFFDETEKENIHKIVADQKEFYETVLDNMPADIGVFSPEFKYMYVNATSIKDAELRKWMIGKDDYDYCERRGKDKSLADERFRIYQSVKDSKKENKWEEKLEVSGKPVEYYLRKLSPYLNSKEELEYIIGYGINITERKLNENKLKEAQRITEESSKAKEIFLANMSHEIRTPMNGIIGIISLLQKTQLTPQQNSYLNIVQFSAQSLVSIINDIIDLEKVGTGKIHLEKITFNLIETLNNVISLYEVNAQSKGVQMIFNNMIGDECFVLGDPTRFNQIINNLLSNAVKFTDAGFITITTIVTEETESEITIKTTVQDSGIGIDEATQKLLFNPFTQAYAETNRKYGGSGLGLSITKNLIELQEGKIWLKSAEGRGTTFYFTIKYKKSTKIEPLLKSNEEKKRELTHLRVLFAEDNEINRLLVKNILNYWGFYYKIVNDGEEAIAAVEEEDFDVILMDIQMPNKNGLEATEAIRKMDNPKKNKTPIIALTANALKGEEVKYKAVGMNGFLTKPFTESQLYDIISQALEKANQKENKEEKKEAEVISSEKFYDLSLIYEMGSNDPEFVKSIVEVYIKTIPGNLEDLNNYFSNKDFTSLGQLAHKLKSTVNTFKINAILKDIINVEAACKDHESLDKVEFWKNKIVFVLQQTWAQLKNDFNL